MKIEVFTIVSMVLTAVVLFVNNIFAVELPLWLFIVNIALGLHYFITVVAFVICARPYEKHE